MTKKAGRPAGQKTEKPPVVTIGASRCKKCDSTERGRYYRVEEKEISGRDPEGKPYTHVVWRWTRCVCGQVRVDRSFEFRPNGEKRRRRAA